MAVDKQDVRFSKPSTPAESKGAGPSGQNDIMFLQENELEQENNTVAVFKRSAGGETLTMQQRMQNDIDVYNNSQVKPKIGVRVNPDFPSTRKVSKKSKKSVKKSAGKMVIAELGKRVEKYDLIRNLAHAQAGITLGQIARGDIDFAKNELKRILSGKLGRAVVNFAGKDEVHGISISRHLLRCITNLRWICSTLVPYRMS